jgi:hypothetical protein
LPHERHDILLLLWGELQLQYEIEEFHGIFEREEATVVELGRAVSDSAQRE